MNPEPCREMEERLVDYADGALPPEESRRIDQHVEQCDPCRRTVDALRESIQIAGTLWQDGYEDMKAVRVGQAKRLRVWNRRYVAVAASLVLAIGGAVLWSRLQGPAQAPPTLAEMERHITESAMAARLLAATDVLKEQATGQDVVEAEYQQILEHYPNTDAAAQVRLKLKSIR
jgi:anti-sigma factor RsiW